MRNPIRTPLLFVLILLVHFKATAQTSLDVKLRAF